MTRDADNPEVRHETSDVSIRAILGFGLALLVAAAAIHVAIWMLFMFFDRRDTPHAAHQFPLAAGQENRVPPEPRLQTNPRQDLHDLRAQEDDILGSYGWVDKNAGVARIPIGEAMKKVVERGLPARQQNGKK